MGRTGRGARALALALGLAWPAVGAMAQEAARIEAGRSAVVDSGDGIEVTLALTGTVPFDGENLGQIYASVCEREPPVPSRFAAVPPGFDAWFARACARAPEDRFQTAAELSAALAAACVGAPTSAIGGTPDGAVPGRPPMVAELMTEPDSARTLAERERGQS